MGYVRGSNKKRLSTEDLDVDKDRGIAKEKEALSKARLSCWGLAGDATASGQASCGLLGVPTMAKPVRAMR